VSIENEKTMKQRVIRQITILDLIDILRKAAAVENVKNRII
jgi:hypothetical protein